MLTEQISVLVVDDDRTTLDLICAQLEEAVNYEVVAVSNAREAMDLLGVREFHVVLTDLCMTPISGWEVIEAAQKNDRTEVVVMTGDVSLTNSLKALHQHVFDFLDKPFDYERLVRTVRNAANHARLRRRNQQLVDELALKNQQLEIEIARVRNELEEKTIRDELTGLYNYRYLMNLLKQEIARSVRYQSTITLAMFDLDYFKRLNDFFGHSVGNSVLRQIAKLLTRGVRKSDSVCRFGGEEFAIVLPETNKADAERLLQRICDSIRAEHIPVNEKVFLTISGGLASCPEDAQTIDNLIRIADSALYAAKDAGRDRLVLARPGLAKAK